MLLFLALIAGSDPKAAPLDYDRESCMYARELEAMLCMVQVKADKSYRLELRDSSKMDPKTRWHVVLGKYALKTAEGEELEGFSQRQYFAQELAPDAFMVPVSVIKGDARREILFIVKKDGFKIEEGWKAECSACTIDVSKRTSAPPKREVTIVIELRGAKTEKQTLKWDGKKLTAQ
jgi:hypothetical protein